MRIRVAQDKVDLLQCLLFSASNPQGVFTTYADILAFAASLGKKYGVRVPLATIAKEPYPINIDVFHSRGYEPLLKLLALLEHDDGNSSATLTHKIENEERMIVIFEEYANGGLSKLAEQLQGAIDYQERILLILSQQRQPNHDRDSEFDLSRFLP